jgi:hypothetical protein
LLVLAYLAVQFWAIPLVALPGISWALWPIPADIVWLAMFPIAMYLLVGRALARQPVIRSVMSAMALFIAYSVFSFFLAWLRFGFPASRLYYLFYVLFRLLQAYSVWIVALYVPMTPNAQRRVFQLLMLAGGVVSASALLQHYLFLDYRSLVKHLPSDPTVSGPWAVRVIFPADTALGTLTYNHILAGHFLVLILMILIFNKRISLITLLFSLLLSWSIFVTQSRSALIALSAGVSYGFINSSRFRLRLIPILAVLTIFAVMIPVIGVNRFPSERGTIEPREETFEESVIGRLERQKVAVMLAFSDLWAPLFGLGLGNLGYFWLGQGFSPSHGQYITVFSETGLVGLVTLVYLYLRLLKSNSTKISFALTVRSILVANLVSAVFNDLLLPNPAWGSYLGLLYCLAGLGLKISIEENEHENSLRLR